MIAPLGLRLAPEKTRVVHIDEGFDFLGFHIRRMRKRGTNKHYVYTTPSRTSVQKARNRLRERTYRSTRNKDLDELITSLNRFLRGWANYFRHGVSKATFTAIDHHAWWRLAGWIRRKHHLTSRSQLRRRFCGPGWRIAHNGVVFTGASSVAVTRYRYRGANIPTPLDPRRHQRLINGQDTWRAGCWRHARPVRRAGTGNGPGATRTPRPCPT